MVDLQIERAGRTAAPRRAKPKPLKPPHAPAGTGSLFSATHQAPGRLKLPSKSPGTPKRITNRELQTLLGGSSPPRDLSLRTKVPGEIPRAVTTPPGSDKSGSPDSTGYPPVTPEKDWFDMDLSVEQRALPRIRIRRRANGASEAVTRSFGNLYEVRDAAASPKLPPSQSLALPAAAPIGTLRLSSGTHRSAGIKRSAGIGRYGIPRSPLQRRMTTRSLSDWSGFLGESSDALRLAHGALTRPPRAREQAAQEEARAQEEQTGSERSARKREWERSTGRAEETEARSAARAHIASAQTPGSGETTRTRSGAASQTLRASDDVAAPEGGHVAQVTGGEYHVEALARKEVEPQAQSLTVRNKTRATEGVGGFENATCGAAAEESSVCSTGRRTGRGGLSAWTCCFGGNGATDVETEPHS